MLTVNSEGTDGSVTGHLTRERGIVHVLLYVTYLQYASLVPAEYLVQSGRILHSSSKA